MSSLLSNIHNKPRLISYLISKKSFSKNNLCVVNVGARGGCEPHWRLYKDQVKVIGFEPDEKECNRLNTAEKNKKIRYYNGLLWESSGKRPFYVTKYVPGSSIFKPSREFWSRFPDGEVLNIKKKLQIETITLDEFAQNNIREDIDFIQLDVEGAELSVLRGAQKILKKSVIGLTLEVAFVQLHQGQPLFADIDRFLRPHGFEFFDLSLVRLNRGKLSKSLGQAKMGQVVGGHALYFRDGFAEIRSGKSKKQWDEIRVFKLASIMELYGLIDCASELIRGAAIKGLIKSYDSNEIFEILTRSAKDYRAFSFKRFTKDKIYKALTILES